MKTKLLLSALLLFLYFTGGFAQTYTMPTSGHTNQTTCSGNFYDSGGASSGYGDGEDGVITFCPGDPTKYLTIDFTTLDFEEGYSLLDVYFGSSASGTIVQSFSGSSTDDLFSKVTKPNSWWMHYL